MSLGVSPFQKKAGKIHSSSVRYMIACHLAALFVLFSELVDKLESLLFSVKGRPQSCMHVWILLCFPNL